MNEVEMTLGECPFQCGIVYFEMNIWRDPGTRLADAPDERVVKPSKGYRPLGLNCAQIGTNDLRRWI